MLNTHTVIGRLVDDPQIKYGNNDPVANYRLAVQRPYKVNGEKPTDFINVVTWGKDAEFISKNGKKGKMIAAKGRSETRSYDHNQYPVKIYVTELKTDEVQVLEWPDDAQGAPGGFSGNNGGYGQQNGPGGGFQSNQGNYGGQGSYQQNNQYGQQQQQQQQPNNYQQNGGYTQGPNGYSYNPGQGGGMNVQGNGYQQQSFGGQQQQQQNSRASGPPPNNQQQQQPNRNFNNQDPFANDGTPIDISDDDLPF